MNFPIHYFIFIPLLGLLSALLVASERERIISRIAFWTAGLTFAAFVLFATWWLFNGHAPINIKEVALYRTAGYVFEIDLYFDKISAVYLFVGAILTFLITVYSRYYLHREKGYKRFFVTVLLFYLGYNTTVLSGNFETLFIGWEILGISSFLLIAFYRERYLPVRNAVKVFTVYRIGDVGILLAMWASHHLWHENITFAKLYNYDLVHEHLASHSLVGVVISLGLLVAAAAKSAQLPFSSWLPRAMEGPTSSSAIFYGSLSVHFGVFLLLRTLPFWEQQTSIRILIGLLGLSTAIVAVLIARVQSSIKSQIAYASIGQIGIIFIEVAAGFETLALFHFAGNAFLRTYQLLVSPSVVTYLIKDQFYNFKPRKHKLEDSLPRRLEYTLYMLSMKEFNLDLIMNRWIFYPLKLAGKKLNFIKLRNVFYFFIPLYVSGILWLHWEEAIPPVIHRAIPAVFAFIGLLMVLKAFTERQSPMLSWLLVIMNHFWMALAISYNEHFNFDHISIYLSGVVVSGVLGFLILYRLQKLEPGKFDLNRYYGHVYEYPLLAFGFLLASLGLMGFPVSPTFIGEDLIFSHIHEDQYMLAFFNAMAFIMGGVAIVRAYARLFLGPHIKTYHETPYTSA